MRPTDPNDERAPATGGVIVVLATLALLAVAGPRVRGLLQNSAEVVVLSLAIAMPVGGWLALMLAKTRAPGRRLAGWLLVALLFLPLYLHAAAWQAAFGQLGWWTQSRVAAAPIDPLLSGAAGVAWVHGLAAAPWVALLLAAALWSVDRGQEEAALLDTSRLGVLGRITARHALTGALVAALWVAAIVAGEMTVTDLLRVRTFAEEIYTQANTGLFDRGAETSSTLPLIGLTSGVALLVLFGAVALRAALRWMVRRDDAAASLKPWTVGNHSTTGRWWMGFLLWLPLLLLLLIPVVNLACQAGVTVDRTPEGWVRGWSLEKLATAVGSAPWEHRREAWLTAHLGVAVATGATLLGGSLAWGVARRPRGRWAACIVAAACLIVPGPLVGVVLIRLLNHPWDSPLAWLTWLYDHTQLAPWLAQMVRATPVAALVLLPAWLSIPEGTLAAARSDGAGRWAVLCRIAAPMRWRAVAVAWLGALAVSVGELAATILVLPPGDQTLTVRIFSLLHYGVEDRVAGIGLCLMGFFLMLALLSAWLLRPRGPANPR